MKIIAKTIPGKEFMYNPKTARKVSAKSAKIILDIVNEYKFLIEDSSKEIWHIYDIDEYDTAYFYANRQAFTIRNGIVTAKVY